MMENITMTCEGLSAGDQAVFERVWKRVMPEPGESCPIEVTVGTTLVGGDLPCTCCAEGERPPVETPEPDTYMDEESPAAEDIPRLGRASSVYEGQLQRQILEQLRGWQTYRHLAKRGRSGFARVLTLLAQEKHRAARQLAAAHFLISGVRYWPLEQLPIPGIPSFYGTVRRCYQEEQQRAQEYRLAAEDTVDPALRELYAALSGDHEAHSRHLQCLLEQSHI